MYQLEEDLIKCARHWEYDRINLYHLHCYKKEYYWVPILDRQLSAPPTSYRSCWCSSWVDHPMLKGHNPKWGEQTLPISVTRKLCFINDVNMCVPDEVLQETTQASNQQQCNTIGLFRSSVRKQAYNTEGVMIASVKLNHKGRFMPRD